MIITWMCGGLGNQMFQYAAGLSLAHTRRTILKMDVSWYTESPDCKPHERYALSAFNLPEQFASAEEIDRVRGVPLTRVERWSVAAARALHFYQYARRHESKGHVYGHGDFSFNPEFFNQPADTYLLGNWQSEKFFAPVAGQLAGHFSPRYPDRPAIAAIAARIRRGPSAFIHFRRGDYVHDPRYAREIGALGLDYYRRAVARLREKHPAATLYLFSDDIESVAREYTPEGPHEFVRESAQLEGHEVLRLMTLCDHAIIANSTLGWWGAWLNPAPQKFVAAPEPWFGGGDRKGNDIVPDTWTRIPRNA